MKKSATLILLSVGAGAALLLAACGRPSSDSHFGFSGTGDPQYPPQNLIHGKYAGSFEITQVKTYETCDQNSTKSCYGLLFSNLADFYLGQGVLNQTPIEGIAGFPLLSIHAATPPRLPGDCYTDLGVLPQLGGTLDWLDAGDATLPYPSRNQPTQHVAVPFPRDSGVHSGPQYAPLYYAAFYDGGTDNNGLQNPGSNGVTLDDVDVTMQWAGGNQGGAGYPTAPSRIDKSTEVIHTPPALANLMVNGTSFGAVPIGQQPDYVITWDPWNTNRISDHQLGVAVTVQVYGPADVSTATATDVEDWPWINKLGETTCLVKDSTGSFVLKQSLIDALVAQVKTTKAYANSTKDVNHDGTISPWSCTNGIKGISCTGEDANGDHKDDKIMGVALIVNRRTENQPGFQACVKGSSFADCSRQAPIFISANDLHIARMKTYAP